MKTYLFCASCLTLLILSSCDSSRYLKADFSNLVEAELAFADHAHKEGINPAFMANLHDSAVIFRPNPISGKKYYSGPDLKGLLTWRPVFADIASSADFGYTTGPWEYRVKSITEKPVAYGYYVSVWQKQADGRWQILIDVGNEFVLPDTVVKNAIESIKRSKDETALNDNYIDATGELYLADKEFALKASTAGLREAYAETASDKIRFYRKDKCI